MKTIMISAAIALAVTAAHDESTALGPEKIEEMAKNQLDCFAYAMHAENLLPKSNQRAAKHNFVGLHLFQRLRERHPLKGPVRQWYPESWSDKEIAFAEAGSERGTAYTFATMFLRGVEEAERPAAAVKMYAALKCDDLLKTLE